MESCADAALGHVLNQPKELMEKSFLSTRTAHRVRGPQGQHVALIAGPVANVVWHNGLMQLMITNGLKADPNRLGVLQCENTNPLALLESRPAAGKHCLGNPRY